MRHSSPWHRLSQNAHLSAASVDSDCSAHDQDAIIYPLESRLKMSLCLQHFGCCAQHNKTPRGKPRGIFLHFVCFSFLSKWGDVLHFNCCVHCLIMAALNYSSGFESSLPRKQLDMKIIFGGRPFLAVLLFHYQKYREFLRHVEAPNWTKRCVKVSPGNTFSNRTGKHLDTRSAI